MSVISIDRIEQFVYQALLKSNIPEDHATWVAEIYRQATLRGVGHHDIYNFPGRLKSLKTGIINPKPSLLLLKEFQTLAQFEGDNGLGEVCSWHIMEQAKKRADIFGMGLAVIRNSNHFLASAPFIEKAAEEGYISILYTHGAPLMKAPGRKEKVISACPMGFSFPSSGDFPIVADFCLTYASGEQLGAKAQAGEKVPSHWGVDAEGNPTTDPKIMNSTGARSGIGEHKGFAFSMLAEVLTAVLADGPVIDEPHPQTGKTGIAMQTAIVIKADGLVSGDTLASRVTQMLSRLDARAPGIHIPGKSSYDSKMRIEQNGGIELKQGLIDTLNGWARELGIEGLE
jgi:LDH2 family malate/lactate/ureidoglycolate dehydrogenase